MTVRELRARLDSLPPEFHDAEVSLCGGTWPLTTIWKGWDRTRWVDLTEGSSRVRWTGLREPEYVGS